MRHAINEELDAIKRDIEAANKSTKELIEVLEKQMDDVFAHLHSRIDGDSKGGPKHDVEGKKTAKS